MAENFKIGKIKFYSSEKGYGFIRADNGDEYFYHVTDFADQEWRPEADQRVKFNVVTGKRGPKAKYVQPC